MFSKRELEAEKKVDYSPILKQTNNTIKRNVTRLKKYLKSPDLYTTLTDNEHCTVDLIPGDIMYFTVEACKRKSPWLLLVNYIS